MKSIGNLKSKFIRSVKPTKAIFCMLTILLIIAGSFYVYIVWKESMYASSQKAVSNVKIAEIAIHYPASEWPSEAINHALQASIIILTVILLLLLFYRLIEKNQKIKYDYISVEESKKKYTAVFDQSPVAIEYYDASGSLINVNNACIEMFGVLHINDISGFMLFEDPNLAGDLKDKLLNKEQVRFEAEFNF